LIANIRLIGVFFTFLW